MFRSNWWSGVRGGGHKTSKFHAERINKYMKRKYVSVLEWARNCSSAQLYALRTQRVVGVTSIKPYYLNWCVMTGSQSELGLIDGMQYADGCIQLYCRNVCLSYCCMCGWLDISISFSPTNALVCNYSDSPLELVKASVFHSPVCSSFLCHLTASWLSIPSFSVVNHAGSHNQFILVHVSTDVVLS